MKRSIPSIGVSRRIPTVDLRNIGIRMLTALTSVFPDTAQTAEQVKPSADSADARRELV